MKLLRRLFPSAKQRVFLAAARQAFESVCQGHTSGADIYRAHPRAQTSDWRFIQDDLLKLTTSKDAQLARRLRTRLAETVESLVLDHFYTNLEAEDRAHFAAFSGSSREAWDESHYFAIARDYAYAEVLEYIILSGWNGNAESKATLKTLQRVFIDTCKSHCELGLTAARAAAQGRAITAQEKESGKTNIGLKEIARRLLSGEEVSEQQTS